MATADVPLAHGDYWRAVAKEARVQLRNRYFESNPLLNDKQVGLISRQGMRRFLKVGQGPIRAVYSQPGSFSDALFVVSGSEWYRIDRDLTVTLLSGGIANTGPCPMAATGTIQATPEYLFMANGAVLYLYMENGYAYGTVSGSPADGDIIQLGGMYYKFTTGSVDAGTPDGTTAATAWLLAFAGTDAANWIVFDNAVAATGAQGVDYSTDLTANEQATPFGYSANNVTVRGIGLGALGNGVSSTIVVGAAIAWGHATLTGGGGPAVTQVPTPLDVGVISVAYISDYVVVISAQGAGINGQFYWIEPGEITIDPLDFATAERSPDPVLGVVVFTDQFWLPGSNTTEVWYFTGVFASPVARLQGVTFDRGTVEGTALQVKESLIIVDNDGAVFQIAGGLNRISTPAIEERIRKAIQYQAATTLEA